MTTDEVKDYYMNSYQFRKMTSMSPQSFMNWMKWGFVPIISQMKLQILSGGKLQASLEHGRKK